MLFLNVLCWIYANPGGFIINYGLIVVWCNKLFDCFLCCLISHGNGTLKLLLVFLYLITIYPLNHSLWNISKEATHFPFIHPSDAILLSSCAFAWTLNQRMRFLAALVMQFQSQAKILHEHYDGNYKGGALSVLSVRNLFRLKWNLLYIRFDLLAC